MIRSISLFSTAAVILLTACSSNDIICKAGTNRCGNGCADYTSDARNCGECGLPCATSQVCQNSVCRCQDGTTSCNGACTVLAYDAQNCGACGTQCAAGQVCEAGACKAACTIATSVRCGDSCLDVASDASNCGGCGVQCQSGQICRDRVCTFEVVAACLSSGELSGFKAATGEKGPPADVGTLPGALASMQGRILSADGTDQRLYQARLAANGDATLKQTARSNRTGSVPNFVLVDGAHVYVANAGSGTLQVLEQNSSVTNDVFFDDAGVSGEVPLVTVAELQLGMNSYPQAAAKVGGSVWVPLYGGYGAGPAAAGQKVVEVSVATPSSPSVVGEVNLAGVDLKPFDAGTPGVARPWSILNHNGKLYVTLNNLEPSTYAPTGPGLLARIEPTTKNVTLIDLGADACLNPQSMVEVGAGLAVSCMGAPTYDTSGSYALLGTEHSGVVMLDATDTRVATWATPGCGGDAGCVPLLPGRLATTQKRLFLADQNAGQVLAFDVADGGLTLERTIQACTASPITGIANVGDVLITR